MKTQNMISYSANNLASNECSLKKCIKCPITTAAHGKRINPLGRCTENTETQRDLSKKNVRTQYVVTNLTEMVHCSVFPCTINWLIRTAAYFCLSVNVCSVRLNILAVASTRMLMTQNKHHLGFSF